MLANQGFTLPELLVILIILAVLGFSVMLYADPIYAAASAADRLRAELRYVQNLAMTMDEVYYLQLESERHYTIRNASAVPQSHPYSHETLQSLGNDATFYSMDSLPHQVLVFDSHGRPYLDQALREPLSAAPLLLCIKIGSGWLSTVQCLSVSPQTGYVR